MPVLEVIIP